MNEYKFKNNVLLIIEDFKKYYRVSKDTIYTDCIEKKLNLTVSKYNNELALNSRYITGRSDKKVLKALTKLQKNQDREILKNLTSKAEEKND